MSAALQWSAAIIVLVACAMSLAGTWGVHSYRYLTLRSSQPDDPGDRAARHNREARRDASATAATTTPNTLVAYSECMRSHGVPKFPDPNSSGGIPKDEVVAAIAGNPHSSAAQTACGHLIPKSGLGPPQTVEPTRTRLADALSFARCVRAHGFPGFPDPTDQGELTPEMVTAAGIDLHQPKVLRAGLACLPASHGLLTPTAIERAVHGG